MFIAVIREVKDEKTGRRRFVIEWHHLLPEKRFSMMATGRRWTDNEISILLKYHHDLKKAAKILGRPYGAVRVKWSEIRKKLGLKRKTGVKCLPFPEPDLSIRTDVVAELLPLTVEVAKLLLTDFRTTLKDIDLKKELTTREKIWLARTVQKLLDSEERWLTGKENLGIYRNGREDAD